MIRTDMNVQNGGRIARRPSTRETYIRIYVKNDIDKAASIILICRRHQWCFLEVLLVERVNPLLHTPWMASPFVHLTLFSSFSRSHFPQNFLRSDRELRKWKLCASSLLPSTIMTHVVGLMCLEVMGQDGGKITGKLMVFGKVGKEINEK